MPNRVLCETAFSGYRTESLGIMTDALVTLGLQLACDDRTMPIFAFYAVSAG